MRKKPILKANSHGLKTKTKLSKISNNQVLLLIYCINNILNSYNSGEKKKASEFQKLVWLHGKGGEGGGKGWQVVVVHIHNTQTEPLSP